MADGSVDDDSVLPWFLQRDLHQRFLRDAFAITGLHDGLSRRLRRNALPGHGNPSQYGQFHGPVGRDRSLNARHLRRVQAGCHENFNLVSSFQMRHDRCTQTGRQIDRTRRLPASGLQIGRQVFRRKASLGQIATAAEKPDRHGNQANGTRTPRAASARKPIQAEAGLSA